MQLLYIQVQESDDQKQGQNTVEMTSESGSVEHHQATQADEEEEEDEEESVDILDGPTQGLQGINVNRSVVKQHKNTPQTNLPDAETSPDITILCEKCQDYVHLLHLQEHRKYHKALATMKYGKKLPRPQNIEMLLKRRNVILRKMKQTAASLGNHIEPREIQKINEAYEYLKTDIDGTLAQLQQMREDLDVHVNGSSLNCSPDCVYAVGFCSHGNNRWKNQMEDTKVYQDSFGEDNDKCFMAVYDGYHGRFASDVAASELHHMLLNEMKKFDPKTTSTKATNMADNMEDISNYKFDRPTTKESEREVLYEGSMNIVDQIIKLCESKYDDMMTPRSGRSSKALESERSKEQLIPIEEEKSDYEKSLREEKTPRNKKQAKPPMSIKMEEAFKKSYQLLDILLSYGKDECSRVRWSGCSATTLILHGMDPNKVDRDWVISPVKEEDGENQEEGDTTRKPSGFEEPRTLGLLHLANAGNVHCVLVRGNQPYRITREHTPNNEKELKRVLKAGGDISESKKEKRVNGVLSTTRGLGNHGDVKLKKCVLVEPYTTSVPIDQYAQFLILASHGVWEVFTPQEATSLLLKLLPSNFVPVPSKISTTLQPLMEDMNSQHITTSHSNFSPSVAKLHHQDNTIAEKEEERELSPLIDERLRKIENKSPNTEADLKTEIGSHMGDSDGESGNEADVETYGDYLSIPAFSRMSIINPNHTRDTYHREFAKVMAEHLVQAALQAGAKDNITVTIALLPGCGL
ncbi:protein phosphatase 2C-like domain-containing protein 1 isoform X4 [Mytilus californianus]|uniref:protein phosphatase 2C-like domain-containing protein 1 isoform X4 n=1 Tax=Mytilus californianus TaxID=6549 RepID=UPI002246CB05|nr:protein phosphatase 2C-like domain-containing protein 1 isoform X4 [Mytilus californianus]